MSSRLLRNQLMLLGLLGSYHMGMGDLCIAAAATLLLTLQLLKGQFAH